MQTSNHILLCAGVIVLSFSASTTYAQEPTTRQPSRKTTYAALYSNGVVLNKKSRTATDYIASVRKNPQRKAAMDRAAQKLSTRLKQDIGKTTILQLRLAQGLTQTELAEKAGLQQSYLSRIENNRCSLHDDTVHKLSIALDTPPENIRTSFEAQWDLIESKT